MNVDLGVPIFSTKPMTRVFGVLFASSSGDSALQPPGVSQRGNPINIS